MNPVENKIAVLGLDNVGKTSLIRRLLDKSYNPSVFLPRTHGIEVNETILENGKEIIPVMYIDIGGLKVFQVTLWLELVQSDIKAIIYMVDVGTNSRIHQDLSAFRIVVENTKVPILVLGNKYDIYEEIEFPMSTNRLFEILDIVEHKINDPFREIMVLPISVKTGLNVDLINNWLRKILSKKSKTNIFEQF